MTSQDTQEKQIEAPTGKHKKFADLYLKYMDQTRAYRETYPKSSYESAMANSSRLIRNDKVSAYIQEQLKEYQLGADEALRRMADIARGDMADFMDADTLMLDIRKAKEAGKTRLIKKIKQRTVTKLGKNESDGDVEIHDLEIELYPADAAIRDVLKVHGKFIDRQDITSGGEKIESVTDDKFNRAISTLADAIRESVPRSDDKEAG